ncbi:MAG: hypothetical protein ACRDPM_05745, partial [Solirubrobacteraceae bacterium]
AIENLTRTGTTVLLTTHYIDEADHLADRVIVLAGGRIVSDTTPHQLRARSGPSTIRYPLPPHADVDGLPARLAAHLDHDRGVLEIRSSDIAGALRALIDWAERHRLDLTGIEVGPPSLEDAYLATIGHAAAPQEPRDE